MKKLASFINEESLVQDIGLAYYSLSLFTKHKRKFSRQSVRLSYQSWTLDSFNCLLHIASTYLYRCLADFNAGFELKFRRTSIDFNSVDGLQLVSIPRTWAKYFGFQEWRKCLRLIPCFDYLMPYSYLLFLVQVGHVLFLCFLILHKVSIVLLLAFIRLLSSKHIFQFK